MVALFKIKFYGNFAQFVPNIYDNDMHGTMVGYYTYKVFMLHRNQGIRSPESL